MATRTILVCETQVPFVSGGAESLVRSLVSELKTRGYDADLVSVPFKWYPKQEILTHSAAWRLLDLSESNGRPVDLMIATKFPTYFARHERKIAWLVHQHREAYELVGTEYSNFEHSELDVGVRENLVKLDKQMLAECRQRFTIAQNTTERLRKYNGLPADTLYPPPRLAAQLRKGPQQNYVLSVGRLESIKRTDLLIRAMAFVDKSVKLIVAGEGTQRENFERAAEDAGVEDRVTFTGRIDDHTLVNLYAEALAVAFVPYDEDYGLVTLEAFLSSKPVITTSDSGGPLEFIEHGINGLVCEPNVAALAAAVNELSAKRSFAVTLGDSGYERASTITWDTVIESLVQE